jgi:excisionase family DNA binding protein
MSEQKEFSVAEAAEVTGFSRSRIYQMIEERQIAARLVRAREDWRLPRATVEELRARKAAAEQKAAQS